MTTPPPTPTSGQPPAVHVHDVSVYFGAVQALKEVTFDLPAGEFLAIVGPNGAGKSTLIKVILGLVRPERGHAAILTDRAGTRSDRIGYVPQLKTFDRTFPATVQELAVTGLRRSWPARITADERHLVAEALHRVGAAQLQRRPLSSLSGGELQRAYLARAFIRRPEVIMLDEPATGVDFLAEHDLYDLLEDYRVQTKATIAMVTHDLSVARYHATRVLVLNRRLHGYGPPEKALHESCLKEAFGHLGHSHDLASWRQ